MTIRETMLAGAALLALAGCSKGGGGAPGAGSAAPSGSAAAPGSSASAVVVPAGVVVGIPLDAAEVAKVVDPNGEAPYAGPTGALKGVVRIEGDAPPTVQMAPPRRCGEALATHGRLFRVGQDKTLADAMVAVTGYKGYVPPKGEAKKLTIHGCAVSKRTAVLAFGQRLEVSNLDKTETYMPYLDGAPMRAVMVAVPGGDAVKLYAQQPGHYLLRDQLPKSWLTADVFVLAYATHDVTDLDGQYRIEGIPVGKVKVDAFLPIIKKTVEKEIEIQPGDNTLDFTLTYDAKKDEPVRPMPPAPASASASAGTGSK